MRACAKCGARANQPGSGTCCRCGQKVCAGHFENRFGESLCSQCALDARAAEQRAVLACFDSTCPICEERGGLEVEVQLFRELPRSRQGATVGTCRDVELGVERKVHCGHCRNAVSESTMAWATKAREAERSGNMQTAINLYGSLMLYEHVRRLEATYGLKPPEEQQEIPENLGYGLRPAWENEPVNTEERKRMVAPAVEMVATPEQKHWGNAATVGVAGAAVAVEAMAFLAMVSLPILIIVSVCVLGAAELARRFFSRRPAPQVSEETS